MSQRPNSGVAGRLLAPLLPCLFLLALMPSQASALAGAPLSQRFTAEDYDAAPIHFAVQSAPDGTVYVGNVEGVLRYDGSRWDLVELPGRYPARSLARGADGRIYVGSYDQLGVLESAPDGRPRFRDLRAEFGLEGEDGHLADVWSIIATPAGVYFRANAWLLFLGYDGATSRWPLAPEVRGVDAVGDSLYARVDGLGMARFEDGRFVLLPGGEVFADRPVYRLFGRGDGLLLVADDGFHLADARGIRPLGGDAPAVFARHRPYSGLQLPDGGFALGTFSGRILRFDAELRLVEQHPIGPYTVLALGRDREGGLWAATEGDLVRMEIPSAWTAFSSADGLMGAISDCVWHQDTLWVANSLGVARAETDGDGRTVFRQTLRTKLESYDLEADAHGLLVAEREGVLWLPSGTTEPRRVAAMTSAFVLYRSPFDRSSVFVLGEEVVVRLHQDRDGSWTERARWPLGDVAATSIEIAGPDELWLGNARGGPERWRLADEGRSVERERFGEAEGLVIDPDWGSSVLRVDGRMLVQSAGRAFVHEDPGFRPAPSGLLPTVSRPMELSVVDTAAGSFAWTSRELLRKPPGASAWQPIYLGSRLARGFTNLHADADGMIRLVTWSGLLQFDPSVRDGEPPSLAMGLRSLQLAPVGGEPRPLPVAPVLPEPLPPGGVLRLEFSLVTMESGAQYRYRIDGPGHLAGWSDWLAVASGGLNVRLQNPGEYRIDVEGRTASGRDATPFSLSYVVAPRWWQTPVAILAAALALMALVVLVAQLIARYRFRQFVALNRRLERKIAERTGELEEANRQLAELATEDSLTGVANRRALEQGLAREWARCAELGVPLAVVMIDVDHFKRFNDQHGHLEGDQQLRRIAGRLAADVRPVRELLARYGGEEFALVLPGQGLAEAMQRAEQLRQRFDADGEGLTISLGVAVEVPQDGRDPRDLVRRADQALYEAKRLGRNRVALAAERGLAS